MKNFLKTVALIFLLLPFGAQAEEKAKAEISVSTMLLKDANATVVELFTSQGCSSCPPAQAFLQDLSRRPDVITLEWHVDYWDQLKTWTGGSWKDPFSDNAWTQRQVAYNKLLGTSSRAYTPEMIIDGKFQEVGSNRANVNAIIKEAQAVRRQKFKVEPGVTADGHVKAVLSGPGLSKDMNVILLRLQKEAETEVKGGENKGLTMKSHNIVKGLLVIGTYGGGTADYTFDMPHFKDNESCAVLLQDPENLHILAGGMCQL